MVPGTKGTVDISGLTRAMREFRRQTNLTWKEIVMMTTLAIARRILRIIPPRSKKQGLVAVGRDTRRAVAGVASGFIDWVRATGTGGGSGGRVEAYLSRSTGSPLSIEWDALSEDIGAVEDFHEGRRDRRGRVRATMDRGYTGDEWKETERVVTSKDTLLEDIRKREAKVGMAKGGLAPVLRHLGARVPEWIARHARFGGYRDESSDRRRPRITFWNNVKYVGNLVGHRLQWVFNSQERAMWKDLRRRLDGDVRKFNRTR